ncbi:MAG TPA: hypothetical protein VN808_08175 [Stellaceae bacterium]|nr:hypothetical protein [Stellaceae bacterium]
METAQRTVARERVVALAAQLAAASGEDSLELAGAFADWLAGAGNAENALAALDAAVTEASARHSLLRGRKPARGSLVLEQAAALLHFIEE